MTYTNNVPNEANLVRGAVSGDLTKMRENFLHLAPLAGGVLASGTDLVGLTYELSGTAQAGWLSDGVDFVLRYNSGSWADVFRVSGSAGDVLFTRRPSVALAPTQAQHLANKAYVDSVAAGTLSGLSDTAVSGAVSGDVLSLSGSTWVAVGRNLGDLLNVTTSSPVSGALLRYNSTAWVDSGALNMQTDRIFNLGAPVDDTDAATKAYVDTLSGLTISGATTLSGLTDTYDSAVVTPASGEALLWDGVSKWTPSGVTTQRHWVGAVRTGGPQTTNLASGDPLLFNGAVSGGTNITFDTTSGIVTLAAGHTYRLTWSVQYSWSTTGQWDTAYATLSDYLNGDAHKPSAAGGASVAACVPPHSDSLGKNNMPDHTSVIVTTSATQLRLTISYLIGTLTEFRDLSSWWIEQVD